MSVSTTARSILRSGRAVTTALAGLRLTVASALGKTPVLGRLDYPLEEARTAHETLWSKGLPAGLADVVPVFSPGFHTPRRQWVDRYVWRINRQAREPVPVYVNTYRLNDFLAHVLPRLAKSIVILCGDSITPVFSHALDAGHMEAGFPRDARVVAVFAQNLDSLHPRAFPLPVGLDFHSAHRAQSGIWGMPPGQTPQAQEDELLAVRGAAAPWSERSEAVYMLFSIATNLTERVSCQVALEALQAARVERMQAPRRAVWEAMAECRYVASPPGAGYDCHRTWEALALGCVPIVKRIPAMSPLFADLPVWEVDCYTEVTDETIAEKSREIASLHAARAYDWQKLSFPWWRDYVHRTVAALPAR